MNQRGVLESRHQSSMFSYGVHFTLWCPDVQIQWSDSIYLCLSEKEVDKIEQLNLLEFTKNEL